MYIIVHSLLATLLTSQVRVRQLQVAQRMKDKEIATKNDEIQLLQKNLKVYVHNNRLHQYKGVTI